MIAIWPAGPPKLMKPSFNQKTEGFSECDFGWAAQPAFLRTHIFTAATSPGEGVGPESLAIALIPITMRIALFIVLPFISRLARRRYFAISVAPPSPTRSTGPYGT
jgi:hypothetical protein